MATTLFDPPITNPGYVLVIAAPAQSLFTIPYSYPHKNAVVNGSTSKFITVRVNRVDRDHTLQTNGTEMVLDVAANDGDEVEIFRDSDIEDLLSFAHSDSLITQENLQCYEIQVQDLFAEGLQNIRFLENERVTSSVELQSVVDAANELLDFSSRLDQLIIDMAIATGNFDVSSAVDGQVLIRQGTSFQNKTLTNVTVNTSGVLEISPLAILSNMLVDDVVASVNINGGEVTIVKFAAGVLVNNPLIFLRHNIPDVDITLPEAAGEVLVYDVATTDWLNLPLTGDVAGFDASGSLQISQGAIDNSMLQANIVGSGNIILGAVTGDHLVDSIVTSAKISGEVANNASFAPLGTLGIFDIANEAVETDKYIDGAVTTQILGFNSVESSHIFPASILSQHLVQDNKLGVRSLNLANTILADMDFRFEVFPTFLEVGGIFGQYRGTGQFFRLLGDGSNGNQNYSISAAGAFTFDDGAIDIDADLSLLILREHALRRVKLGGIDLDGTETDDIGDVAIGRAANAGVSQLDFAQTTTHVAGRNSTSGSRTTLRDLTISDGESWSFRVDIIGRATTSSDVYANVFHGWINREGGSPTISVSEDADYPKLDPSWDLEPTVVLNGNFLRVQTGAQGSPNTTILWTTTIRMTKVQQ